MVDMMVLQEYFFCVLIDCVFDYFFVKDIESCFVIVNLVVSDDFGICFSDLIGKMDFDFYFCEFVVKFFVDEQEVIMIGNLKIDIEEFVVILFGQKKWFIILKLLLWDW